TLGFTPGQVVGVYAGQILAVCVPACLLGVALGRLLATPLLAETARAYSLSRLATIPAWAHLVVLLGVPAIVGLAAVGAAAPAGGPSAVQAITVGRAPRSGRGFGVRRALAATRLPRPVSFGLGTPSARPARAVATVVAVLLGATTGVLAAGPARAVAPVVAVLLAATTVVLAAGLATSLSRVEAAFTRASAVQVNVELAAAMGPGGTASGPVAAPQDELADPAAVRAAIRAQPGTARLVGVRQTEVDLA